MKKTKTNKKRAIKSILLSSIIMLLSALAITSNAAYITSQTVHCQYKDGGILVKWNSEDRILHESVGATVGMTTQSIKLPYVYCIEYGEALWYANYQVRSISTDENNHIAYILSHQKSYYEDFKDEKKDPVQIALWYSDLNVGGRNFDKLVNDITNQIGNRAEAEAIVARGRNLYNEAKEFEAYRNLYRSVGAPRVITNNNTLNSNGTVGPFSIRFTEKESMGITWGGMTGYSLTGKDMNGNSVTLRNGTDWIFADSNGNNMGRPSSNQTFYIKLLNNNISEINRLHFDFKQTYAKSTWLYMHSTRTDEKEQELLVQKQGERGTFNESLNLDINRSLSFDLEGTVFVDKGSGKGNDENGIKDGSDMMLGGIPVDLVNASNHQVVKSTTTDSKGHYSFKAPAGGTYYVRFQYNGQKYEPTTYNNKKKKILVLFEVNTSVSERSYATEGIDNRKSFNNRFSKITKDTNVSEGNQKIYAYTGYNGQKGLKTYSKSTNETERKNVNLGLMERETANLSLSKDLWEVNISINGKKQTYVYNLRDKEPMEIALRGTDVEQYQREIRKSDIEYLNAKKGELEIKLTYRIRMHSGTDRVAGEVSQVSDYYDMDYTYETSYTDPKNKEASKVEWEQKGIKSGNGIRYQEMTTRNYSTGKLASGEDRYIYVEFEVKEEAIKDLLKEKEKTKENYAQIDAYSTYYRETRLDLNKQRDSNDKEARVMHEKDEVAGLIDTNSTPGNFNPTETKVQKFVHETSKTESYKKLPNTEKVKQSYQIFEDDADMAPGLTLIRNDNPRTIVGNVWEDSPLEENLAKNLRKGDGIRKQQVIGGEQKDKAIEGITVKLYTKEGEDTGISSITKADGSYELIGFVPGDYEVRFQYGDSNRTVRKYNGQDYKSTVYEAKQGSYWYTNNNDNKSDAIDSMERREEVNSYSKDINNQKAKILRGEDTIDEATLMEKTNMYAKTEEMTMEIEYARQRTTIGQSSDYVVRNVDFGIVQRPISQLVIEKKVEHLKIITTDGQVIFDSTEEGPNLAWIEGNHIQATIDDSLIHGSTIEIAYKVEVRNEGEKNYVVAKQNERGESYVDSNGETVYVEDPIFYQSKDETHDRKAVVEKTKASKIVDYIENNLNFNSQKNEKWEIIDKTSLSNTDKEKAWIEERVTEGVKGYNVVIEAKRGENRLTEGIEPGETRQERITVSKVMANDGTDELVYKNTMEIVGIHQDSGRRQEESIVGNYNPKEKSPIEKDTAKAEDIIILGPFGEDRNTIYYIIGVSILAIALLGTGIILIKRKVIQK